MNLRYLLLFAIVTCFYSAYAQQDMDLHLNATFLKGKNILKVKRDFNDPYLWVLAQNNEVYRINSITKVVDDYTATFSAYNNFQFIDIAGRSQDTVFIATNSSNVIEYKKGIFKTIGVSDGLTGLVNNVGIDNMFPTLNGNSGYPYYGLKLLLIATTRNVYYFDYVKEVIVSTANYFPGNDRLFENTYRTEVYSDLGNNIRYPDTSIQYSVINQQPYTRYSGAISHNTPEFGYHVNTAYFVIPNYYHYNIGFDVPDFLNQIWGTENGLFLNNWDYSYYLTSPHSHYLSGIKVNKVTSIYGLTAFGSGPKKGLIQENLLVGTDNGLYFSNSGYEQYTYGNVNKFNSYFHFDELGNTVINDICVDATSYSTYVCEDAIWVGAANGLYFLIPDYARYINTTQQLQAIQFSGQASTVTQLQLCTNTSVNTVANSSGYSGNTVQWYKDGQEIPNASSTTLSITQAGDYSAILYDPCSNIHFESNHLQVSVIAGPVFSFNYPDTLNYCDGSTATLSTDNNALYQYRWYKDGVLNGNTINVQNTTQSGKYYVEVSACAGNWVASKSTQINFIKVPQPLVSADQAVYCAGDNATLKTNVPIDASAIINWQPYQYRWYKDGALNGSTSSSLIVTQPGKYKVEVTSCSANWVSSQELQVSFITITPPLIIADKAAYCIGDQANLSSNFVNDGTFNVNWYLNGILLPGDQNKASIIAGQPGNYTMVVTSKITSCSQSSAIYNLSFTPPPTVSIVQIINTNLCDGQTVNLKASYTSGTVKWSTGETTDDIGVKLSGIYGLSVTTAAGCVVNQTTNVQFYHNPVLSLPDATLCQFTNQSITLTAPDGFTKYEWNNQPGTASFSTDKLGTVNLVVTDANGCKASQTINITSRCDDIHLPNTFTPNGDGINDTWTIAGLTGDPSTAVRVYNRLGTLVFQSIGYISPWDGTYKGKKLPGGVYYYVISARQGKQVVSGSVTIIY